MYVCVQCLSMGGICCVELFILFYDCVKEVFFSSLVCWNMMWNVNVEYTVTRMLNIQIKL